MKGVSLFLEAIILLAVAVVMASMIGAWLSSMSTSQVNTLTNSTSTELQCQSGRLYVRSASYNCASSCAAGTQHNTTLVIVNSGKIKLSLDNIYILNTSGYTFALPLNETIFIEPGSAVSISNVTTATCNGINNSIEEIQISSRECPSTAASSIKGSDVTFANC